MKVLVGSPRLPSAVGGLETYLRGLACSAKQNGRIRMEFLYCPSANSEAIRDVGDYEEIHTLSMSPRLRKVVFSMASRPLMHRLLEIFIYVNNRKTLLGLANRKDIQAVHFVGTGWDFSGFALLDLARLLRVPFTVCPFIHPQSWGDDIIDLRLYRASDAIFCQTVFEADYLVARGVPKERLVISGQPPSVVRGGEGEVFRESLQLGERPTVLFIGRRDEGKGYPALLNSWSFVLRSFPDAVLLIAGPMNENHKDTWRALPPRSVYDLGVITGKPKADAIAACDVFCLPSAHESFGIVYVDAWSYAKPVICGTAPACRELIENGVTGLHASQDPEKLSEKICELLSSKKLATKMGLAGLLFQQDRYTEERLFDIHLSSWCRYPK
jgi:glycosyltransferase involved in cell wall biosynthesis